jgi:hypothetical protein
VDLSDSEPGEDEDDDEEFEYPAADYSARMEELLSEPEDEEDEDDPDSEFVYTGVDAEVSSANYRDQLRDVLGPEHEDTDRESHDGSEGPRLSSHENQSGETLDDATVSPRLTALRCDNAHVQPSVAKEPLIPCHLHPWKARFSSRRP